LRENREAFQALQALVDVVFKIIVIIGGWLLGGIFYRREKARLKQAMHDLEEWN
jgi:uncharacterized membrane protein YciS (DUF1049 family)